jgi:NAD(P)-dependent dehydrogenase (short-subunit alcohol dehydrogenase family)
MAGFPESAPAGEPGRTRQVVHVTGASRGVGRATALAFARAGSDLLLTDICASIPECPYPLGSREELDETASLCGALGARVVAVPADVRDQAAIDAAVRRCAEELGEIDVLVNNAGIVGPGAMRADEMDEAAWAVMIDVDLNGVWRTTKAAVPGMMRRRRGSIVNVASTAGLVAFPHFANYVAAKHGVIGLTRALALDYASFGIRVNAVCPTSIRDDPRAATGMLAGVSSMLGLDRGDYEALSLPHHPLGTLVDAADVVSAIVWLASDAAARVTGIALPVDAGFSIR